MHFITAVMSTLLLCHRIHAIITKTELLRLKLRTNNQQHEC